MSNASKVVVVARSEFSIRKNILAACILRSARRSLEGQMEKMPVNEFSSRFPFINSPTGGDEKVMRELFHVTSDHCS